MYINLYKRLLKSELKTHINPKSLPVLIEECGYLITLVNDPSDVGRHLVNIIELDSHIGGQALHLKLLTYFHKDMKHCKTRRIIHLYKNAKISNFNNKILRDKRNTL